MATNPNNLVDLKLLNIAYGINKKRIDNLSKKVITEKANISTLNVGTTTVTGTANVIGGTLNTDTLTVTGGLNVNGSMVASEALTLEKGGTVTGDTTLDSLTGSIKLGKAFDTNGNATDSASVIVPSGKALTISGTATASNLSLGGSATIDSSTIKGATLNGGTVNLNSKTLTVNGASNGTISGGTIGSSGTTTTIQEGTVNLNSKTFTVNNASDGTITSSTISSSTIQNGTIDLNSKTLTVSSDSTITNTTSGSTITLEGVGAIDAKSMTLTTSSGASLNINNTLGNKNPDGGTAVACNGGIRAAKVYNAVWNDLADSIEVPQDTELEYGYCYKYKNGKVYKTNEYTDPNVLGIHSDTAGMVLGIKPSHIKCINLAVAGVVLAYVDNEYECGTPLVATKEGKLTKANKITRVLHPERIVATYFRKENNDFWGPDSNKIAVNGRSWVKIK